MCQFGESLFQGDHCILQNKIWSNSTNLTIKFSIMHYSADMHEYVRMYVNLGTPSAL